MHDISIGFSVLVWRTHQKKWIGSYKLLVISRETCIIELSNNFTNFRVIIVKFYLKEIEETNISSESPEQESSES